ncbi:MAG: ABC transporter permease, partial [Chloroflexi bacterium]|nr:ABC transporter permease [Chloroflexota bacterium]
MRILDLAFKDLAQILRDKKSLLFLAIMPLVFTAMMGMAFQQGSGEEDPRLPVGWVNADAGGPLAEAFYHSLQDSQTIRLVDASRESAGQQVRDGHLAGALILPAGFSRQTLEGQPPQVLLVADANTGAGQAAYQAIQPAYVRLMSSAETARLVTAGGEAAMDSAFQDAMLAWSKPTLTIHVEKAVSLAPAQAAALLDNPYNQSSPGMIVQFAIFGITTSATVLVLERKNRTLQRLLTTSMSRAGIIAGHLLAMFLVVLAQEALLIVAGQFIFHVDYFSQPLAVLLMALALGLWVASLGLFIGTLARGEEQVILLAMVAMFLFSALGGAWFALEMTGKTFAAIGHFLPSAWAMDGFQNVLVRGQGLESTL